MELVTTKYDDTIINSNSDTELNTFLEKYNKDEQKSIIIKTTLELTNRKDFELVCNYEGINIFANTVARQNCAPIINNEICTARIILIINGSNIILVRSKNSERFVSPGGSLLNSNETYKQAGIRETFEEIGIKIEEKDLVECGSYKCKRTLYGMVFNNTTKIFYVQLALSYNKIKSVLSYKSNEIEQVIIVPSKEINVINMVLLQRIVLFFVINKLRGRKILYTTPEYIIDLVLF